MLLSGTAVPRFVRGFRRRGLTSVLAHMEHDGTHDPVRKLVLYGMAHADSPREVLPEGDHCRREAEPGH